MAFFDFLYWWLPRKTHSGMSSAGGTGGAGPGNTPPTGLPAIPAIHPAPLSGVAKNLGLCSAFFKRRQEGQKHILLSWNHTPSFRMVKVWVVNYVIQILNDARLHKRSDEGWVAGRPSEGLLQFIMHKVLRVWNREGMQGHLNGEMGTWWRIPEIIFRTLGGLGGIHTVWEVPLHEGATTPLLEASRWSKR